MHTLKIEPTPKIIRRGHLAMGGRNPAGQDVSVNSSQVEIDGQPVIPIAGEFQFSRYPQADWDTEILKMAAGGVNTVATYLFWNHHEAQQGIFDWKGDRDLRQFVILCARHGLWVVLRVGPFAHGECRNGGLPDWLYGQPYEVRSNDAGYLERVQRYFEQVAAQVEGLRFEQGGPILAVQVENEFMHTGAPWETYPPERGLQYLTSGLGGSEHMITLKRLLIEAGVRAPIFSCTAWGSPVTGNDFLPMFGGYAYPVWVDEIGPSSMFLFRNMAETVDLAAGAEKAGWYPAANAEMQGGIQVRYGNRPLVDPKSTEAFALVSLGSGSNWLGYYVYHGGIQPTVQGIFSNERLHPRISYDFQAPLGDFGLPKRAYHLLRRLHLFLKTWGSELAPMGTWLPVGAGEISATDTTSLRYAARSDGGRGFLFINNFQDHAAMADHPQTQIAIELAGERIVIPGRGGMHVQKDAYAILPFNLEMQGARLRYATTQPITCVAGEKGGHYFFFAPEGMAAEYCWQAESITEYHGAWQQAEVRDGLLFIEPVVGSEASVQLTTASGARIEITTLSAAESEMIYQGQAWGQERVVLSPANLVFNQGMLSAFVREADLLEMLVFPAATAAEVRLPEGAALEVEGSFARIKARLPKTEIPLRLERLSEEKAWLKVEAGALEAVHDLFVEVDYEGDMAEAYLNGKLVHDHFHYGPAWQVGLKRFAPGIYEHGLVLVFYPLKRGQMVKITGEMASRMEFSGDTQLAVRGIRGYAEYRVDFERRE